MLSSFMFIFISFGSKVRGKRTGILFNDEMDDFSTPDTVNDHGVPASPSNYIKPRKMPMSSMAPAIILNKEGKMVFVSGASGGTRITSAIAFVSMMLDRIVKVFQLYSIRRKHTISHLLIM